MAKISCKRRLSAADFDNLMKCFAPGAALPKVEYFLVERAERIEFERFPPKIEIGKWSDWQRGRLFGAECEMRWRRDSGCFHVVYISDDDQQAELSYADAQKQEMKLEWSSALQRVGDDQAIYLWGEYDADDTALTYGHWLEGRVGRLLQYPIDDQALKHALNEQEAERQSNKTQATPPIRARLFARKYRVNATTQDTDSMIHRFVAVAPKVLKVIDAQD